ncbi:MAG: AMP-binding protein, partial [Candidatus Rokubacteria bacterium]|nr:AMP-binding protein [Candidatus Rokubacteria bacterium]
MFWARVERSAGAPAQMVKRAGGWETLTWAQVGDAVRELALGLLARGRQPGDAVALLSASRAEWVQADFAILSAGCVTVPVYPTYTAAQIAAIVNDAGARALIVEDRRQLAKVLPLRERMPRLAEIVVIDGDVGHDPSVLSWTTLRQLGRERERELQTPLADRIASLRSDDVATIAYTSGTTGEPKGVVQTHGNHLATLTSLSGIRGVEPGDVHLLFLPLAHSFARLEAFLGVHRGLITAFAESLQALPDDLVEVRPNFIFAVPRVFEKIHAAVMAGVDAGTPLARRAFSWAMRVGYERSRRERAAEPVPRALVLRDRIAHRLVFSRLRRAFGGRL